MYNQEIREQYFATLPAASAKNARWRFLQISEAIEVPLQKDVTEMTIQELRAGFASYDFIDVDTSRSVLTWFRSYNRWAHDTGQQFAFTDALEVFNERADVDYTSGVRKFILSSPEVLVSTITRLYKIDEGYEVLPALIFAWVGVPISECVRVKSDAVDFRNRLLTLPDGSMCQNEIPEAFIEPLRVYASTRVAKRFVKVEYTVYADDLGFFLKKMLTANSSKQGKKFSPKQISANITDFCYRYERQFHERKTLNYTTVAKSGAFYSLYQLECVGVDLYAKKNKSVVLDICGKSATKFKDVMTVYEAYRKVFYPRS